MFLTLQEQIPIDFSFACLLGFVARFMSMMWSMADGGWLRSFGALHNTVAMDLDDRAV